MHATQEGPPASIPTARISQAIDQAEGGMHRSSSYYLSSTSSSSSSSAATAGASSSPSGPSGAAGDQLPTYDPRSDAAKKEALDASRAGLARTLVHLVPVVVLLCGLLLWSLSATDVPVVGVLAGKGSDQKMVARVKLLPRTGESEPRWNGSGMRTGTEADPMDKAQGTKRSVKE